MAALQKPVLTTKPVAPATSTQPVAKTTLTAKKSLKLDVAAKKPSAAAPAKTPVATTKFAAKPVVTKMTPAAKGSVTSARKFKSDTSVTTPPKPAITKSPVVKRVAADSTSSLKEIPASTLARKPSIPSGLTKTSAITSPSMSKSTLATKPVISSDSKLKTVKAPITKTATTPTAATKTAVITRSAATRSVASVTESRKASLSSAKIVAKPTADPLAKLPKAKVATTLPSKASPVSGAIKPTATGSSTLAKRVPVVQRKTDIKKPVNALKTAVSKTTGSKTAVSKTAVPSQDKPRSIRTPIVPKIVSKVCQNVQICDADSTSPTTSNNDVEIEMASHVAFDLSSAPSESISNFTEDQAYKVAEQMVEVLGMAVVSNEPDESNSSLKDSVAIDVTAGDSNNTAKNATIVEESAATAAAETKVVDENCSLPEEELTAAPENEVSQEPAEPKQDASDDQSLTVEETQTCDQDLISFDKDIENHEQNQEAAAAVESVPDESSENPVDKVEETQSECIAENFDRELVENENNCVDEDADHEVLSGQVLIVEDNNENEHRLEEEAIISDREKDDEIENAAQEIRTDVEEFTSEVEDLKTQDEGDEILETENCPEDHQIERSQIDAEIVDSIEILEDQFEIVMGENSIKEDNTLENQESNEEIHSTQVEATSEPVDEEETHESGEDAASETNAEATNEYREDCQRMEGIEESEMAAEESCCHLIDENIDLREDHFVNDGDIAVVDSAENSDDQCNSDGFVVIETASAAAAAAAAVATTEAAAATVENADFDKSCTLVAADVAEEDELRLARNHVVAGDDESVASFDSVASYADIVKLTSNDCCEPTAAQVDTAASAFLELDENMSADADQPTEDRVEYGRQVDEETKIGAEGHVKSITHCTEDLANAEEKCSSLVKVTDIAVPVAEEQNNGKECEQMQLIELFVDELQNESDVAGAEQAADCCVDEEGYEKVQKKRNKRHNKKNRKSFRSFKNENVDDEPLDEVQENFDDDQQQQQPTFQKRRNSRRHKNLIRKQHRRNSEPYTESRSFMRPVWRSFYHEQ